jgi:hypothetical protein
VEDSKAAQNFYVSICPETKRVFICQYGRDGNIAEVFAGVDVAETFAAAPRLRGGLKLAIKAMNNTPGFNTGMADPKHPGRRNLSSYALLPQLEAILREIEGGGA